MGYKKNTLPFNLMPGHWGLKGYSRELAKIDYEYEGYDNEIQVLSLDLNYKKITLREFAFKELEIKLRHNVIDREIYDYRLLDVEQSYNLIDADGYKVAKLDLDFKYKKIEKLAYEKEKATIKKEPWVTVVKVTPNPKKPAEGEIELDWNEPFVTYLKEHGYQGVTNDQIVDAWFNELSKNIALEHYSGIGDFDDRVGATNHEFIKSNNLGDGNIEIG